MDKVAMFGAGSGGTIAVLAASVDRRIKAVDLLDPWGDWPEWMAKSTIVPDGERAAYTKPAFLSRVAPFDPVTVLPTMSDRHVRMQLVSEDPSTPGDALKKLAAAMPKDGVTLRYETAQQLFSSVSGGRLFDWTKDQLRPDKETGLGDTATQKLSKTLQPGNGND